MRIVKWGAILGLLLFAALPVVAEERLLETCEAAFEHQSLSAYSKLRVLAKDGHLAPLQKLVESGNPAAQYYLGIILSGFLDPEVKKDDAEASRLFRNAADQFKKLAGKGDADAQFHLGLMCWRGQGVQKDASEALRYFHKAVDQGNLAAMHALGDFVYQTNVPESIKWYRKAAEGGFIPSQYFLGSLYSVGYGGVPKDTTEAIKWLKMAAEQGSLDAQVSLASRYGLLSLDLSRDPNSAELAKRYEAESFKWRKLAAEQGDVSSQNMLGGMYREGEGTRKDLVESVKWFRKAADQGDPSAQRSLAFALSMGEGVPQDYTEAAQLFRPLAERGDHSAQSMLGLAYESGHGVPQDLVQAHMWLNLAAVEGQESRNEARTEVERGMSPEQIAEAQRLAREWKPKK